MKLDARCNTIELILADVDGVLTDGGVIFDNQGIEIKRFHARDGLGIKLWQRAGFPFGLITARTSHIVKLRAAELGIEHLRQGFEEKLPAAREIMQHHRGDRTEPHDCEPLATNAHDVAEAVRGENLRKLVDLTGLEIDRSCAIGTGGATGECRRRAVDHAQIEGSEVGNGNLPLPAEATGNGLDEQLAVTARRSREQALAHQGPVCRDQDRSRRGSATEDSARGPAPTLQGVNGPRHRI